MAQGGKFGAGFASGFVSSGFSVGKSWGTVESRTFVMAMVGGATSEITGGKFANGAVTGAFVHLFNAEGHLIYPSKDKFIYVKDRIDLNKDALLTGAQDGHLTLDEAILLPGIVMETGNL